MKGNGENKARHTENGTGDQKQIVSVRKKDRKKERKKEKKKERKKERKKKD